MPLRREHGAAQQKVSLDDTEGRFYVTEELDADWSSLTIVGEQSKFNLRSSCYLFMSRIPLKREELASSRSALWL